ncbi:serpin family protein [Microbacterium marinilacus]|uniref:Serpin family protein n=1 Tax=Microbacterium marinilacus TaxID=415209 RepID=A0ABP7B2M3_9MICO|nr:serpin family protein [Microbacterium marinilacus]MBY0688713.1 serpin family protein [Microbacterium marinilacus]
MSPSRWIGGAAALVLTASLASCATPSPDDHVIRAEGVSARAVSISDAVELPQAVAAARELGAKTLALADPDGNVVLSPAGLATALSMLADGARGATLAELESVLGATGDGRRDAFAAVRGALSALDGDPSAVAADELPERPLLHLASQVVVDEGFEVRDDFLAALADTFDAGSQQVDLGGEEGKAALDAWVREHTGGLIEQSAIEPDPQLRIVLQDAVLLAAAWKAPFDEGATAPQGFTLADGTRSEVDTMSSSQVSFASAERDGWRAVRLPYDEALHADILLPPEGTDPATATGELLGELATALDDAAPEPIALSLPVLDIGDAKTDLLPLLPELGLGSLPCTSGSADLSGIALAPGDLCVDQAVQQAVLSVDEAGTVAAAVTELGMTESSALVGQELAFDRPFLFTVSHDETGWPLFLAAVRAP